MLLQQQEIAWFDPNRPEDAPDEASKRAWIDPNNPENPFYDFVGNELAVRRLCRSAYTAFGRYNRWIGDQSYALLGPASTGKTLIARKFAKLVDLPFIELLPRSITSINDILSQISKTLEAIEIPDGNGGTVTLELHPNEDDVYVLPPCIIFIDEVHSLRKNIEQALLSATEKGDCTMTTELGWKISTKNVCWIIATTDRGKLFDAFDTRFTKIVLRLYSLDEISQIIKVNNPDWSVDVCDLVAKFGGRVPREALSFAREVRMEQAVSEADWEDCVRTVAEDNQIDEFGMSLQRVEIIKKLAEGPISRNDMQGVAQCKEEELLRYIMPPLMAKTPDQDPLVFTTSKGYALTKAGIEEAEKRGFTCINQEVT